jgi:hypothetical protein
MKVLFVNYKFSKTTFAVDFLTFHFKESSKMAVADTNFAVVIIIAQLQVLTLLFMTVVFEAFSKLTNRHTALVLLFSKVGNHLLFTLTLMNLRSWPRTSWNSTTLLCWSSST